jgi:hypothetical protein
VSNSLIYLHPLEICTPEIGEVQYEALRQLARASGSNRTEIDFSGTVAHMVDWAAPMPVLSATTKVASERHGRGREGMCGAGAGAFKRVGSVCVPPRVGYAAKCSILSAPPPTPPNSHLPTHIHHPYTF